MAMKTETETQGKRTHNRGFAAMPADRQREIASQGGMAAHARGTAHEFTPAEAREAGRKGGRAVSRNHEHMVEIGRQGGKHSHVAGRRHENEGVDNRASIEHQGRHNG
jgi:general stress protein YciG